MRSKPNTQVSRRKPEHCHTATQCWFVFLSTWNAKIDPAQPTIEQWILGILRRSTRISYPANLSISWNDTCNSGYQVTNIFGEIWFLRLSGFTTLLVWKSNAWPFLLLQLEWIVERRTSTNTTSPIHFPLTSIFTCPPLKLTANAPAYRPGPKRKCHLNQPLIFRGFCC